MDSLGNLGRIITRFDKLYRVIQTETADPAGNIFVDTQYDGKGRRWKVSSPYRSGDNVMWTQFQYDATDRPTVTTSPDASTIQYLYNGNQTVVTDEAGNERRYTYDGIGSMTKVEEPNPTLSTPLVTTYTYNGLGKLTQTTQGVQTRTFNFDSLGQMTSQVLPESGTTSFTYNADGLQLTKTDARNITTTITYHATHVHKLATRSYSDSTPMVSFQYDSAGRMTQMTDGLGIMTYAYVPNSDRLQQEQRSLTGITGTFTTSYAYNIKGDLTQMTYPSGRVVNFNYATGGGCCNSRLSSVVDQTASQPPPAPFSAIGGTVTTVGGYTVHTFTAGGTFIPNGSGAVEVLVVGGGGGGGHNRGGGGGGGGLLYNASFAVTAQAYNITVGSGGTGGAAGVAATGGASSTFGSLTALGGGHGASADASGSYGSGGSGGGAVGDNLPTQFGSGTPGQGNNGGGGSNSAGNRGGGGGGGAGAAGITGSGSKGGDGGNGLAFTLSGASVTYGGGGGAGILAGDPPGAAGTGGAGGGTNQNSGLNGGDATANTGGGGGGSGYATRGGNGGSGIVIIRYPTPSTTPPPSGTTLNSGITYNAAGEIIGNTLGNSVAQTYSYNSRLQLTGITASLTGRTLMNFTYDYGTSATNTGRVLSRTDAIQPEHSVDYDYDSMYRLSQAVSANDEWGIAWTFDLWGNRLTQTPQGLAYSLNKVGTQTFGYTNNRLTSNTYDAAGNQTNDGLHNYTFNAENQITQMDGGAAVYAYDGEGRRMKKTVGSETTYFFYGVGGLLCEFTTTNTGATQAASTDRATYRTSDKLGSAVLILNASGAVIENNRTLPYGEAWLPEVASTNDKKFTTYERDSESGLDYAGNRYFQSQQGKFLSVDHGRTVLYVPASLNRYVFAANDPVNYHDPSGNEAQCLAIPDGEGRWINTRNCIPRPLMPSSDPDDFLVEWQERERAAFEETEAREFAKKVGQALQKGMEKLRKADKDCEELFAAIGLTSTEVELELNHMIFENGTTSSALIQDVASPGYANATGTMNWTVSVLFDYGFPPLPTNQQLNAWSPAGGTAYLRPSAVSWNLLVHETLHQFIGPDGQMNDGTIMSKWGLNTSGPSSQISDKIKEKCD